MEHSYKGKKLKKNELYGKALMILAIISIIKMAIALLRLIQQH